MRNLIFSLMEIKSILESLEVAKNFEKIYRYLYF